MSGELPVVLLGGAVNAVSAARSAGRHGREVHLLAETPARPAAAASRFATSWQAPRPGEPLLTSWRSALADLPPAVLIPCGDNGVELLATSRAELVAAGHHPAEGDDDFLRAALDKEQTYALADAAGVPRPRFRRVSDLPDARDAAAELGFPCGVKPRVSHAFARLGTGRKGAVLREPADLDTVVAPLLELGADLLVTEVVPGPDSDFCSYYGYRDASGRELLQYTKRKLRQYPVRFGTGTYHLTDDVPAAAELGRRFFASAGLRGLGNVEFKLDSRSGRLVLIECNPRLTAATELVRRSGIDLVDLVYDGALGRAGATGPARPGLHQWLPLQDWRAARDLRRAGELSTRAWLASLLGPQSFPVFDWSDPGPSVAAAATVGRRVVRRWARP